MGENEFTAAESAEVDQAERTKMNYATAIDAMIKKIRTQFPGAPDFFRLKNRVFEELCEDLNQYEK